MGDIVIPEEYLIGVSEYYLLGGVCQKSDCEAIAWPITCPKSAPCLVFTAPVREHGLKMYFKPLFNSSLYSVLDCHFSS